MLSNMLFRLRLEPTPIARGSLRSWVSRDQEGFREIRKPSSEESSISPPGSRSTTSVCSKSSCVQNSSSKNGLEVHREALRRLHKFCFDEIEGFGLDDNGKSIYREVAGDHLVREYSVDTETGQLIVTDPVVSR